MLPIITAVVLLLCLISIFHSITFLFTNCNPFSNRLLTIHSQMQREVMRILDTQSACTAFQESLQRHGILPGYQLTSTEEIMAFSG